MNAVARRRNGGGSWVGGGPCLVNAVARRLSGVLGTLFDPCRLAYLTYTSNDCVRPLLTMNFPT